MTPGKGQITRLLCCGLIAGALGLFAVAPPLVADIVVDPNGTDAGEITDEFGKEIDPTTTTIGDNLVVGFSQAGELRVDTAFDVNGLLNLFNAAGTLGFDSNALGTVTVTGNGATWDNDKSLVVGSSGTGLVNIENGGAVTSTVSTVIGDTLGSVGTVWVNGAGSTLTNTGQMNIGGSQTTSGGNGTLTVENGGAATSTSAILGSGGLASGTVTVTGNGSSWNNSGELRIGNFGTGRVDITNGGSVTTGTLGSLGFGIGSTGSASVVGSQSTWTSNNELRVGGGGTGTLSIEAGATVTDAVGLIAAFGPSTGTATVIGDGSTWNHTDRLFVGGSTLSAGGTGTLLVGPGGAVNVADTLKIWNSGTVALGGGSIVTRSLDNIDNGTINHVGGTLAIVGGQLFPGGTGVYSVDGVDDPHLVFDNASFLFGTGYLSVGSTDSGSLTIRNGSLVVVNSTEVATGSTGSVTVTDAGSTWTINQRLDVGTVGAGMLTIDNGGTVTSGFSQISSSSNSTSRVTVNGAGSTWTVNDNMVVGLFGNAVLNIENGGSVISNGEASSIGEVSGATGLVTVTGTGSMLNQNGSLTVGWEGAGTLTIDDGGTVTSGSGSVADSTNSTGRVTVNGAASTWTVSDDLAVGRLGNGVLNIENGGSVISNGVANIIGEAPGAAGMVTVTGTGSMLNQNGSLTVGWEGSGTLNVHAGGTVTTTDSVIGNIIASVGSVHVMGAGSTLTNTGQMNIGGSQTTSGGNGTLTVENGGAATSTSAILGSGGLASGTVTVTGNGSSWNNSGELRIGNFGTGRVDITNGGSVTTGTLGSLGFGIGSTGSASVVGSQSTWTSNNELRVGGGGTGTLSIEAGATVTDAVGLIAAFGPSTGTATVIGDGSTWNHTDRLFVGGSTLSAGGTGTLLVGPGGAVNVADTLKIWNSGTVALGGGSIVTRSLDNIDNGTINHVGGTLAIVGGQLFPGGTGVYSVDGVDDPHLVFDNASFLFGTGYLYVGNSDSGSLTIRNGSLVVVNSAEVASLADSTGAVTVTDAGSTWTINQRLDVGAAGAAMLAIENGGTVTSGFSGISSPSNSTSRVTVNGAGSTWTVSDNMAVGIFGNAVLNIENGGSVISNGEVSSIGVVSGTTGLVTVTGTGSTLTQNGSLTVGEEGTGTLTIDNGGTVTSGSGSVADRTNSTGRVTVSGPGSSWTTHDQLAVAQRGSGTLHIENGGTVTNNGHLGIIGQSVGATGAVIVRGAGSTWTNTGELYVGGTATTEGGSGTLTIETGAAVTAAALQIWPSGQVNLFGGTLTISDIAFGSNPVNFIAGTLHIPQSKIFSSNTVTGLNIAALPVGKRLRVDGTATIGSPLTLAGGTLSSDAIIGFQLLDFQAGTLELTRDDLSIGITGQSGATVDLTAGKHIAVTNRVTIDPIGLVNLTGGTLTAATTVNNGQIHLAGVSSLLHGSTAQNHGLIAGDGRVGAALHNQPTGQVRNNAGQTLSFLGSGNTNAGVIATVGGMIAFAHDLTNTARIDGQNAIFQFSGGLINDGQFSMSVGNSSVFGAVTNAVSGKVNIAGASTTTFFGGVTNAGDFFIGSGSTAVFAGDVTGSGNFLGSGGTVEFTAGFSPGSSPGEVSFDGSVTLGAANRLVLELAGTTAGREHDQINVAGHLAASGTLDIQLLGGFAPRPGDRFDLLDFGSLSGSFSHVYLPTLGADLSFDISSLMTTGSISVIPEPTSLLLLGMSLSGIMIRRRSVMNRTYRKKIEV